MYRVILRIFTTLALLPVLRIRKYLILGKTKNNNMPIDDLMQILKRQRPSTFTIYNVITYYIDITASRDTF